MLFRNQGNGTFADVSTNLGLPNVHLGRAAALADLDHDGDLDLLLGGESETRLRRNPHAAWWNNVEKAVASFTGFFSGAS